MRVRLISQSALSGLFDSDGLTAHYPCVSSTYDSEER